MNTDATAKIAMLKDSMRCLAFGLLGLLPLIGLPFAFLALWLGGTVRRREKKYWNPAKPYRIWGVLCGATGATIWTVALGMIIVNAVTGLWNNDQ